MKKIILLFVIVVAGIALIGFPVKAKKGNIVIMHFFESAVCPACKKAKKKFPELKNNYRNLKIISYQVMNKHSRIDRKNRNSIKKLINMLKEIDNKLGGKPFIIKGRKAYPFYTEKGIPYYMKRISKSTVLKKEIPIPVFIIGDKVILGFNETLLKQAIDGKI